MKPGRHVDAAGFPYFLGLRERLAATAGFARGFSPARRSSTGTAKVELLRNTQPGRPGTQGVFSRQQASRSMSKCGQENVMVIILNGTGTGGRARLVWGKPHIQSQGSTQRPTLRTRRCSRFFADP